MGTPSHKRFFVFGAVFLAISVFFASGSALGTVQAQEHEMSVPESTTPEITDDEINGFLFRINEDVRNKVMALGGESTKHLPIPVLLDVSVGELMDTWREARAGDRVHTGIDIMVPLGELVVSPTDAVVTKIGYDDRGGNFVVTANPGGEQFYFAHLDRAAENLSVGNVLKTGDVIGYVGNTGNARGKLPHLHFGIYYKGLDQNPFSRLVREFSFEERADAVERLFAANNVVLGVNNGGVRFLQRFLIQNSIGSHREALAKTGATGYFGLVTKNALAEYQWALRTSPASGYFDLATREHVLASFYRDSAAEYSAGTSEKVFPEAVIPYSFVCELRNSPTCA